MRVVRAAAVQLSPVLYRREGTVEKVVCKIHELGGRGVQFATFPETVVPHYAYFSFLMPAYRGNKKYFSSTGASIIARPRMVKFSVTTQF